jgi:hypothetical protein
MKIMTRNQSMLLGTGLLLLVASVAVVAFFQGMAYANKKAAVQVANDDAFYSLAGMKLLKDPQDGHLRELFEGSLYGSALTLSDLCLKHPAWIQPGNYNLLVHIHNYLKQNGKGNPSFRPVAEVEAKVAEAITRVESIHPNVQEWKTTRIDLRALENKD